MAKFAPKYYDVGSDDTLSPMQQIIERLIGDKR